MTERKKTTEQKYIRYFVILGISVLGFLGLNEVVDRSQQNNLPDLTNDSPAQPEVQNDIFAGYYLLQPLNDASNSSVIFYFDSEFNILKESDFPEGLVRYTQAFTVDHSVTVPTGQYRGRVLSGRFQFLPAGELPNWLETAPAPEK